MFSQFVIVLHHVRNTIEEFVRKHPFASGVVVVYAIFVWPVLLLMAALLAALGMSIAVAATLITLAFMPLLLFLLQSLVSAGGLSLLISWVAATLAKFTFNRNPGPTKPGKEQNAKPTSGNKPGYWERARQRYHRTKPFEVHDNVAERATAINALIQADTVPDVRMASQRSVLVYSQSFSDHSSA